MKDPQIIPELIKIAIAFCVIAPLPFFFLVLALEALV
jgi:hypothetical protein|tara:strand:+ start:79 stop:189 length:111 start_codon:yes stop_codon:yes gene_type:complete